MKREAISEMYEWKGREDRKPLILRGARQVGKTWLMKEFAAEAYSKYAYINFEDNEIIKQIFQKDFDIERILLALQLATDVVIDTDTLIIFDELQEAPRGLTALKYFQEKAPQYHIVAAGSLLGIAMHEGDSFPVGKVDFMDLYPLTFFEFLDALGQEKLKRLLKSKDWELISAFHSKLQEYLRLYYYVGGMPEVVSSFITDKDLTKVRRLQQNILDAYDRDFSKHAPLFEVPRIRMVWKSIAAQLSKENRKFIYGQLKEGVRAKDFEIAIEWLRDAGLIYRVNRVKKGQMPLSAYEDFSAFKLFMLDTGLMCAVSNLPAQTLLDGNTLFSDYKGALTEQYVLQQLEAIKELSIYYWSSDNSRGEIDFLLQYGADIIPVEVKAEENLQSKSLRAFVERNPGLHGVRFSMSDHREQDWLTNYPLYSIHSLF
nr:ATP-binding protein [Bacteroides intestinalis]